MKAKQILIDLKIKAHMENYPSIPLHAIPQPKYTDKTANGLTKMIIEFLQLSGWQAERISTTGRYIDNTKIVSDVLGRKKQIGSGEWIKSTSTKGSADVSATIKKFSVKIEIKIGRDRQSAAQIDYMIAVNKAGGVYVIAKDFDQFHRWYENFIKIP
jgi:hypothetical protein